MTTVPKQRYSNIELYRIITMILIVAHHYVMNSGIGNVMYEEPVNAKSLYLYIFGMWGKTGINGFVLITGYFMCKSRITLRKFMKLLLWIYFYRVIIYLIFSASGYHSFHVTSFLKLFLPFHNLTDGFTGCYLVFFLFIPFLNKLINNLSKKEHLTLVAFCLFIYTIWDNLTPFTVGMNYVIWFCILYFVASFIRIYHIGENISNRKWGVYSLLSIIISIASVIIIVLMGHHKFSTAYHFVSDSNAIMAVVASICSFMFFKSLPIGYRPLINQVAAATFGVFLIHTNGGNMRQWLWKDFLDNAGHYSGNIYLHSVVCVLAIFTICTFIDIVRLHLIEKPTFKMLDKQMAKRNNKFIFQWT